MNWQELKCSSIKSRILNLFFKNKIKSSIQYCPQKGYPPSQKQCNLLEKSRPRQWQWKISKGRTTYHIQAKKDKYQIRRARKLQNCKAQRVIM
jgi:hypothetical protein